MRTRSHVHVVLVVLLATASGLVACGGGSSDAAPGVTRTDSAGIAIVRSPGEDRPLDWRLEPVFTVGGADAGPESFFQVRDVGADSSGNLYVLDGGNERVVVFGPAGGVVRTQGAAGQGPGELSIPTSLSVTPAGSVAVFDARRRAFVRYDPSGAALPDVPVPLDVWGRARWVAGGVVAPVRSAGGQDSVETRLVAIAEGDTTVLERRTAPPGKTVRFESCGVGLSGMTPVFEPTIRWSASGAGIAAVADASYAVDRFREGRLVASYRRSLEAREATEEMARRELGEGMKIGVGSGQPRTCKASEVVEKLGFAPVVPAIKDVALAADGTLWVERKVVGKDARGPVDVFSPEGEYLGTLPAGSPLPAAFLPGDRVAAVRKDSLDIERVAEYRVAREGS